MKNRIIWAAVLSLVLILSPRLAFPTPTDQTKKKETSPTSSNKISGKTNGQLGKKSKTNSRRTSSAKKYRNSYRDSTEGGAVSSGSVSPATSSVVGVPETSPLIRVIPQRDGRFLLEPLKPKKPANSVSRPTSQLDNRKDQPSSGQGYNKFEPWNFSELIMDRARGYCGARYSRGSSLAFSSATDCSGFVQYIYQGFKMDLPRSSAEQAQVGRVVTQSMDFSKMLPGDLLFFRRGGRHVGHAGIYLGEGKMIHASNHRNGVTITDLREPYYQGTFVVAKRVFEVKYGQ